MWFALTITAATTTKQHWIPKVKPLLFTLAPFCFRRDICCGKDRYVWTSFTILLSPAHRRKMQAAFLYGGNTKLQPTDLTNGYLRDTPVPEHCIPGMLINMAEKSHAQTKDLFQNPQGINLCLAKKQCA